MEYWKVDERAMIRNPHNRYSGTCSKVAWFMSLGIFCVFSIPLSIRFVIIAFITCLLTHMLLWQMFRIPVRMSEKVDITVYRSMG